ncbi:hypothetical protein Mapa_010299 [Marchantia paleacea]|nr:hypothetical protein Mapa_010299 [Marchantia paleacea]
MRPGPEQHRVVRHPLAHPLRTDRAVKRRPAVQVVVLIRGLERSPVKLARLLRQRHEWHVLQPRTVPAPVCGHHGQAASASVRSHVGLECAVHYHHGVLLSVPPVGQELGGIALDFDRGVGGFPAAFVSRIAVDVEGLWAEAHHGEGVAAASVGSELDEEERGAAQGNELPRHSVAGVVQFLPFLFLDDCRRFPFSQDLRPSGGTWILREFGLCGEFGWPCDCLVLLITRRAEADGCQHLPHVLLLLVLQLNAPLQRRLAVAVAAGEVEGS